jgi:hypothetical protein
MRSHLSPIINKANYYTSKTLAHIETMKTSTVLQAFRISVHLNVIIYCGIVIGLLHNIDNKISKTIGTATFNKKYVKSMKYIPNVSSIAFSSILPPIYFKFNKIT